MSYNHQLQSTELMYAIRNTTLKVVTCTPSVPVLHQLCPILHYSLKLMVVLTTECLVVIALRPCFVLTQDNSPNQMSNWAWCKYCLVTAKHFTELRISFMCQHSAAVYRIIQEIDVFQKLISLVQIVCYFC